MYHLTSHLRLNAVYWGLTALCVMKHKDALDREELLDFVMSCWDEKAGTQYLLTFASILNILLPNHFTLSNE
jgi:prenyltransferase beta subunit